MSRYLFKNTVCMDTVGRKKVHDTQKNSRSQAEKQKESVLGGKRLKKDKRRMSRPESDPYPHLMSNRLISPGSSLTAP